MTAPKMIQYFCVFRVSIFGYIFYCRFLLIAVAGTGFLLVRISYKLHKIGRVAKNNPTRRYFRMEILTWQARTQKNMTLKELSAMTGISKTTLNYIENGITSPTLRQLEAIAQALDVKMTDLFDSPYK